MKYFTGCKTIEEAKKTYRELLKQYHPDHAGKEGEAATVEIIRQFNIFLDCFISNSFNSYYADKETKPDYSTVTPFQEVLKKIIRLDCEIEIIGYWIYCFNSFGIHECLKELGGGLIGYRVIHSFHAGCSRSRSRSWFSGKHKAWVYSGGRKSRYVTKATLEQLRQSKGNYKIVSGETEQLFV